MTDASSSNPPQNDPTPAEGGVRKRIGTVLTITLVVALLGFRAMRVANRLNDNPGQAAEKERLDRAIEEMRLSVERGEASETTQRLMGVPEDKIKKQKPPQASEDPASDEAKAPTEEKP